MILAPRQRAEKGDGACGKHCKPSHRACITAFDCVDILTSSESHSSCDHVGYHHGSPVSIVCGCRGEAIYQLSDAPDAPSYMGCTLVNQLEPANTEQTEYGATPKRSAVQQQWLESRTTAPLCCARPSAAFAPRGRQTSTASASRRQCPKLPASACRRLRLPIPTSVTLTCPTISTSTTTPPAAEVAAAAAAAMQTASSVDHNPPASCPLPWSETVLSRAMACSPASPPLPWTRPSRRRRLALFCCAHRSRRHTP